ncbi:glutamate receptor-like [Cimex lectularius]|uniref:Ionotropic glutamate receptor C-terminal domain-containing protein n=1 Tax=Cimex lectularius TaxID=79782 RepID=A0A8I6SRZ2_CIMLE|nr:glutamate receptor-like [Cimex lectularius]XP_024086443.1 glutamate receptor-like [Cimex lectularius]
MKDLKGKEVRFTALQYLPHVNLEPFDGDEARIFIECCERHNCTIKVYDDDGHQWGNFSGYKQGNGIVGRIYKGEADVGGGSFTTLIDYYPHIDYSKTYMLSGITVLVPKAVQLSAWRTPFLPFGLVMWIVFFCCVISSSLGLYAVTALAVKYTRFGNNIKKKGVFTSLTDSMIRSFGMSVLQQPAYQFVNSPVRHLFTSFEFLYLILTACYSAELASYLTSPQYTKPIDTYEELASSGLTWIADHPLWTFGISASHEPRDVAVVKQFRVFPFPDILKKALTGKDGLAIERIAEGHYSQHAHITEEVVAKHHVMKEMINASPLTMVFEKGSAYADSLDDHINRLHNGGIYIYWEYKMARKLLDYRIQLALTFAKKESKGSDEPKILTIEHIQGAFFIYALGICISFGFLAFELLQHKNGEKLPNKSGTNMTKNEEKSTVDC